MSKRPTSKQAPGKPRRRSPTFMFHLSAEDKAALLALAERTGIPAGRLCRDGLAHVFKKYGRKPRKRTA
jgi:hypothetical protein